ncbi:MAG TPA: hypothetical protein VHW23_10015 [Kofleriaceae bacterium]|jgi:6-phosphogluconolactonase (cycloisomerase 2 family)|nr:hypothetical protein [Kofleriaceae bacterium]
MERRVLVTGIWLAWAGCAADTRDAPELATSQAVETSETALDRDADGPALYTLSNDSTANRVLSYRRLANGGLLPSRSFATGGEGSDSIVKLSQDALVFDPHLDRFFAVNAGDNTVSMLAVDHGGGLRSLSTAPSSGVRPVSITVHDDLVYVLNQGAEDGSPGGVNISGFQVKDDRLVPIHGSTQPLSAASGVAPTDLSFTPDGRFIVVAETFTSKVDTFKMIRGVAQPGNFQPSAGPLPFSCAFNDDGFLLVSEIGNPDLTTFASSVSSYSISSNGTLTPITVALPFHQNEACWLVPAGKFAYIANSTSGTITGIEVSRRGQISLLDADGITARTGENAIDLALSPDHRYLYSLAMISNTITSFAVGGNGHLTERAVLRNVPVGASGLVAR